MVMGESGFALQLVALTLYIMKHMLFFGHILHLHHMYTQNTDHEQAQDRDGSAFVLCLHTVSCLRPVVPMTILLVSALR